MPGRGCHRPGPGHRETAPVTVEEPTRRFTRAEKEAARRLVYRAIENGQMSRPDTCGICGASDVAVDAHHPDYARPLDVEWVCGTCHAELHASSHVRQRRQNVERAFALRAQGKTARQIADVLGVTEGTVFHYFKDPDGSKALGRKRRARRACEDCGRTTTRYRRCLKCARKRAAQVTWTKAQIVEALRDFAQASGQNPVAIAFAPAQAKVVGRDDLVRLFESHHWPSIGTIKARFGSWPAALEAAGFERNTSGRRVA